MDFQITGLSPKSFKPLFGLNDSTLADLGMRRAIADDATSFPCRVSLAHAEPSEELILMSFEHQGAHSPYRATGPIYVRRAANIAFDAVNVIPEPVRTRLLSVRAYDAQDLIVEAEVVDGEVSEPLMAAFFQREEVAYLHVHYARRGCYACRVERAQG